MKNHRRVAIIGHFGGNKNMLDGQTIKTKILYEELSNNTSWKIIKVDTYYKSHNPIKLLLETIICLLSTKDIIVLLSGNGMKFYFPLLVFAKKVFKTNVYHDVIGGDLDVYIRNNPEAIDQLNSFKVNWVETEGLRQKLNDLGIHNCSVLPNFKRLPIVEDDYKDFSGCFSYRFCMFSRVMKEKGIEDAISAIQHINQKNAGIKCSLDIYGRVDAGYKKQFESLMGNVGSEIKYRGTVPYSESVEAIKEYYALLFPTFWGGEGFPGTIVDALSAGLPVVASDWNCNKEIVDDRVNGVLYPNDDIHNLEEAIEWIINQSDNMNEIKRNCIKTAKRYQPDAYIAQMVSLIERS